METRELRKIWRTLAAEKLIEEKLAKTTIMEIISKKGYGVLSKILRKLQLDYQVYLGIVILIPLITLFVTYYQIQFQGTKTLPELARQYTTFGLLEAFMIYALMTVKGNIDFITHSSNNGTLKESLLHVRSYFQTISRKGFWKGTISIIGILAVIEFDTLTKMGGIRNMNFSFDGPFTYESYFSVFLLILIIAIPFIVKMDAGKYSGVLHDLEVTLEELEEEQYR